ncbi:MAG TPA: hypothetical protein DCS48_07195 [Desulfovibrio sp.]|nr:hypothetical protein [Desulfovibrio sp.]
MKKITVLFTVLMMLVASSAWAVDAVFPGALNGSSERILTGFNVNASASLTSADGHNKTFTTFNSTHLIAYSIKGGIEATTVGNSSLYGNIGVNNESTGATMANYGQSNGTNTAQNSSTMRVNTTYTNIDGLTALGQVNGSSVLTGTTQAGLSAPIGAPYFFINTPSYDLMAGVSNATFAMSRDGDTETGANFALGYVNGTFLGTDVYSSGNTWDMYAVGFNYYNNKPYYMVGQVKINSAPGTDNAQVKYAQYDSDGTLTDNTSSWITYNATTGNGNQLMSIFYKGQTPMVENATINKDRNLIAGYAVEDSYKHFVVLIKNGQTLSDSDIRNRGFKLVYAGSGLSKALNNATLGLMDMQVDNALSLKGNYVINSGRTGIDEAGDSLNGYTVALANTDQFKLTQSNMTLTAADADTLAGNFYGKQSADKSYAVGIYQSAFGGAKYSYNLAVMIPNSAVVANIQSANVAYQNNSTITTAGYNIARNNTEYSKDALRTAFTGIPSSFIPLTNAIGFNATFVGMGAQKGDVYYTFQVPFSGVGNRIDTLDLYKIFPTDAKTVRSFSYASEPTSAVDGAWWISQAVGDGYMSQDSYLLPGTDYYINYVLKDNGNYDYRSQAREFGDPIVLGVNDSSSSSSGCVFNPAAGFGLEWLLLMLAPMVAVVRSRFKK